MEKETILDGIRIRMIKLVFLLGDQLSEDMSSLRDFSKEKDLILMCEIYDEAHYVKHHKKKIILIFSAMRHFAESLRHQGFNVEYVDYQTAKKHKLNSFSDVLQHTLKSHNVDEIQVTHAGEYRVQQELETWHQDFDVPVHILEDDRFLCSISEFKTYASGKKQLLMEFFYRMMRKKYDLLMEQGKPIGGKWNYDKENRRPADDSFMFYHPLKHKQDVMTQEVIQLVEEEFPDHFGSAEDFWFATTQSEAEESFQEFLEKALNDFGTYQDAMLDQEKFIYHSVCSIYLNIGLLDPLKMCRQVEETYRKNNIPLNSAEGFIRQILGWREFVRGIYWTYMPDYDQTNYFDNKHDLPAFYWNAKTDMNCMKCAIQQTIDEAYAHHIQRLMVTGNFALIYGVVPQQICEWYLAVYADAFDWVECPNTHGMVMHADGGVVGTKPYAASGKYIQRMSNYCENCIYDVKKITGDKACPFNFLYKDFLITHFDKLKDNHRMRLILKQVEKLSSEERKAIQTQSEEFRKAQETY